ncbi:MAG: hypothetical protein PVSMB11_08080 [Desulfuromonadaceae bacterium]
MRAVRDIISRMGNKIKTKSRKGYQAVTRTFAQLRGRIGAKVGSVTRKSTRSKGGGRG